MNISFKNKIVWVAPERCGTSITKKILEKYDFFVVYENGTKNLCETRHSHSNFISENYIEFKKVMNIRNPYDRVFSFFVNFHLHRPLTKKSQDATTKFNEWVSNTFLTHNLDVFISPKYQSNHSFFDKWTLNNDFLPDFVIRVENLSEDLRKLPFIMEDNEFNESNFLNLLQNNSFLNKRYQSFNEMYDFDSAKLVYRYYKSFFYKFNYNPFSFTNKPLTDEEKIKFLHG